MTEIKSVIPVRLKNAALGGHVAGAEDIIDDTLGKDQSQINQNVQELNTLTSTIDQRLGVVEELGSIMVATDPQEYVGIATAASFESDDPEELAKLPTVNAVLQSLDAEPTPGSIKAVQSNGVQKSIKDNLNTITSFELLNYAMQASTGKFLTTSSHKHACIPVKEGERYYIELPDDITYAFATSSDYSNGGYVPVVSGTSVVHVDSKTLDNIVIPAGCTRLLASYYHGEDDSTLYKVKKYPAETTVLLEADLKDVDYQNIANQHKLIHSYTQNNEAHTINTRLVSGHEYYLVVKCTNDYIIPKLAFGDSASNTTTWILYRGLLKKGYNIFKVTYDGANYFYSTVSVNIDTIYFYDTDLKVDAQNDIITSIVPNAGGELRATGRFVEEGSYLGYTSNYITVTCSGAIDLYQYDENSALSSYNIMVMKEGDVDWTVFKSGRTALINNWVRYDLPYTITKIGVGTGTSTTASTDTNCQLRMRVYGNLYNHLEDVDNRLTAVEGTLEIPEYVELSPTTTTEGKCISSTGVIQSSSGFILYTFAIESGKSYYIHARLNKGWASKCLVCYSTDAEGTDVVGYAYQGNNSAVVYVPTKDSGKYYEKLDIPVTAQYFHVSFRNTDYAKSYFHAAYATVIDTFNASVFNDRLTAVENGVNVGNEIPNLYGNSAHLEKLRAVTKGIISGRGNEDTHIDTSSPQPLVLLHFSDAHGSSTNFQRVLDYYNLYSNRIDDVIHTGDIVSDYYEDGIDKLTDLDGFEKVLNVIGNHDSRKKNSTNSDDIAWVEHAGKDCYDTYIDPYISNWGDSNNPIVQPTDASDGKCYYYKDYTDKGIRLIVIDNMVMSQAARDIGVYDENQITWFEDVLSSALQNELTVIVAMHFPNDNYVYPCAFTGYYKTAGGGNWATSEMKKYFDAVADFKQSGGQFACWFCGHSHQSILGHPNNREDQLIVCIGSTVEDARGAWPRVTGTKTQDFFQVLVLDTERKAVRVLHIGCEYDAFMRHRECFSYSYETNTFIKMSE